MKAEDVDAETAKPQSFRRRRKGPNDDELSGEEQGGSAGTADGPGWGLDYSGEMYVRVLIQYIRCGRAPSLVFICWSGLSQAHD